MASMQYSAKSRAGAAKRIGVVLDMFDVRYQAELLKQLRLAALQRRTELVVFPGGRLGSQDRGCPRRKSLYELVSSAALDGAILLSSCLSSEVGPSVMQDFCRGILLPLCSIGDAVAGVPSLLVNNEQGMRQLTKHLIVDHGYRHLGFLRGPEGNGEADLRYRVFCEELAAQGMQADPALVRDGNFLLESGRAAMASLLEQSSELDAVVAANDYMALGALEALTTGKLPRRIAVVGFDNIAETSFSMPTLTTVEQPLALLAESAVRCILSQLQGDQVPERSTIETVVVVRRSCGCSPERRAAGRAAERAGAKPGNFELEFTRRREAIMAGLSRASRGFFRGARNWEATLVGALLDDLRGVPGDVFMSAVENTLRGISSTHSETWRFHDVLTVLRSEVLQLLTAHPSERAHAEDLFQLARVLAGEAVVRVHAQGRLELERTTRALNDLGTAVAQSTDADTLRSLLRAELPKLGLRQAFVALYHAPPREEGPRRATLFFSLDAALPQPQGEYSAHELLPDAIWRAVPSLNWVVLPLFFQDRDLGFALLELELDDGAFYDSIGQHLSVGLSGAVHASSPSSLVGRVREAD
jgi:sigma-B regulation protein RsbU (phosphoserine phosphatase)